MDPKKTKAEKENLEEGDVVQPDPETLHTTDPQEEMEGPVSSVIKNSGKNFDSAKTKEEANKERDKNM